MGSATVAAWKTVGVRVEDTEVSIVAIVAWVHDRYGRDFARQDSRRGHRGEKSDDE